MPAAVFLYAYVNLHVASLNIIKTKNGGISLVGSPLRLKHYRLEAFETVRCTHS